MLAFFKIGPFKEVEHYGVLLLFYDKCCIKTAIYFKSYQQYSPSLYQIDYFKPHNIHAYIYIYISIVQENIQDIMISEYSPELQGRPVQRHWSCLEQSSCVLVHPVTWNACWEYQRQLFPPLLFYPEEWEWFKKILTLCESDFECNSSSSFQLMVKAPMRCFSFRLWNFMHNTTQNYYITGWQGKYFTPTINDSKVSLSYQPVKSPWM